MKLKEKGKYFELPIIGNQIKTILYDGFIRIYFNTSEESYLDFHSGFIVNRFNQSQTLNPTSKEALIFFFDYFREIIKDARASKTGELYILFENNTEIVVEDGPYENWHFTLKSQHNKNQNLFVHGGVGSTYY